jgi:YjbE family integral membrane protein
MPLERPAEPGSIALHIFADPGTFGALFQVIMIDLVLAGDNAVVIGLAAAGLPHGMRRKAIIIGISAATVLRIAFAFIAVQLLAIVGLLLAGGILLLWVCWKMWQETRAQEAHARAQHAMANGGTSETSAPNLKPAKTMQQAVMQIVVADVSMSLDNVLAVAGAAMDHVWVLAIGLVLSIALMGVAASLIAGLLQRHPWISYAGLIIVVYVAMRMIWFGGWEIMHAT